MFATLLSLLAFADSPSPVSVDEMVRTYKTNAARADERFVDRVVIVTGKVEQITRGGSVLTGDRPKQTYHLWMAAKNGTRVCFRFTEDRRAELANLDVGQEIWVQGRPLGAVDHDAIHVLDCLLVPIAKTEPPMSTK